eukprot:TRINITY_DN1593_c0_g2_i1.p1 TRINITY_DN1593_c0_g2~~TRINITY_DN1593_c0_g2_i1.p1  ORF type:complete len:350 (-),score=97.98 TRINITY_DN1593_c0_g2_i1:185-1234(-)
MESMMPQNNPWFRNSWTKRRPPYVHPLQTHKPHESTQTHPPRIQETSNNLELIYYRARFMERLDAHQTDPTAALQLYRNELDNNIRRKVVKQDFRARLAVSRAKSWLWVANKSGFTSKPMQQLLKQLLPFNYTDASSKKSTTSSTTSSSSSSSSSSSTMEVESTSTGKDTDTPTPNEDDKIPSNNPVIKVTGKAAENAQLDVLENIINNLESCVAEMPHIQQCGYRLAQLYLYFGAFQQAREAMASIFPATSTLYNCSYTTPQRKLATSGDKYELQKRKMLNVYCDAMLCCQPDNAVSKAKDIKKIPAYIKRDADSSIPDYFAVFEYMIKVHRSDRSVYAPVHLFYDRL